MLIAPLSAFLFPVITELFTRERTEKMQLLHSTMTLAFIVLAIWISAFMFQLGTPVTVLFFGEAFTYSGYILQFSAPFLIFNLLNQINFQFLSGTGKAWSRTISVSIALPINIILNIILIKTMGVEGSALAVGLSWIPLYICTWYFTLSFQKIPKILPIMTNIIACAVSVGIIFCVTQYLQIGQIALILLAVFVYFCIFLGVNFSLFKEGVALIKANRK